MLLEIAKEADQEKYRNIEAWHTYGARVLLDGQFLFVQLSTFQINGIDMVSLYHGHNVMWEDAYRWSLGNTHSETGPEDPVTGRVVSREGLAKHKLYQLIARGSDSRGHD